MDQTLPAAVEAPVVRGVRPRAWLITHPEQPDWNGALWHHEPTAADRVQWGLDENVVAPLYDQSALDNARQAIYEAEAAQLIAPLRAEIGQLRHALAQSGKLAEDRLQQMKADRDVFLKLRSKLDRAPVAIMDTRDALGLCAPTEDDFPALYALKGRRVALVDLGPNLNSQTSHD